MSANKTAEGCRFCSEFSQANGEDPIGSAGKREHWLIFEIAPPWLTRIGTKPKPMPQEVIDALKLSKEQGINLESMAIAPDREFAVPGYKRVFHFHRPAKSKLFSKFEKHEFLVPDNELGSLAISLLACPEELPRFEQYRQHNEHIRELMVCTHGNKDVACARFGYPIYKTLREKYAVESEGKLRVWRCSHFGGHRFAPTLVDLPKGHHWGHLKPEILELLVKRNNDVARLRPYYRGWAGLSKFEQIVEREIWMREGWNWLDYFKAGQVLAMDEQDQKWAEVRIDFAAIDRSVSGAYEARVEATTPVKTMGKSGDEQSIKTVQQYLVTNLVKVS